MGGRRKSKGGAKAKPPGAEHEAGGSSQNRTVQVITKYDMTLSQQRLLKEGFHPAVTNKSKAQLLDIAGRMIQNHWTRPVKDKYREGQVWSLHSYNARSRLTRGLLYFRKELGHGGFDHEAKAAGNVAGNGLVRLLDTVDIGGIVAQNIFVQGYKAVHNVAMASSQTWNSLVASTKLWDFFAGELFANGPAAAFIAIAPEYTVGEFAYVDKYDPAGLGAEDGLYGWFKKARNAEQGIYIALSELHRFLKRRRKPQTVPCMGHLTDTIQQLTRLLTDVKHIHGSNQFHSTVSSQVFDPSANFCLMRLQKMMNGILQRRSALKVLYFQKIPFLDRRVLAVILRACPLVEMVGIYDCPLMHFADVICLLDLIHEVNGQRRRDGNPIIRALDFYPRYHHGMPFQHWTAETFGLTWGPQSRDVAQRGFFTIILKAFMKAKALRLDLLFDKGKAFRDFLYMTPNYSLAVPTFLDALYRISDLRRNKAGPTHEFRQALYDLLKPVRVGLEKVQYDWPKYFTETMGNHLVFCSSCGYEMLQEFFTNAVRIAPPHQRVCAGCNLSRRLDTEDDHLKTEKMKILDLLFPSNVRRDFNRDAPLGYEAEGLIKLKTTETTRPPPPPLTLNSDGHIYQPQFQHAMVRDNKINFDSVQTLPTLEQMMNDQVCRARWSRALNGGHHLDMYSRLCRRLCDESEADAGKTKRKLDLRRRVDGGLPDHPEEHQPPRLKGMALSHSFASLVDLEVYLYDNGWL
ncbi:hypothetical protein XA68_15071 [Ophiocordyceps unilateralis]|uniref:Uncharacterized protein n=1 Tax=Ophiocordyceps unilateralis TaxID=268505 RepID=A0A2A9PML5_OPHUN|nr:hypothetical protein XA68_15071 [Ophiocordyceps unilateralis]